MFTIRRTQTLLISTISSNSLTHMSLIVAEQSYEEFAKINFDYHFDIDS